MYRILLEDLIDIYIYNVRPHILATRGCCAHGPYKERGIRDVVFPGALEPIGDRKYHLWTGLSDARIGRIVLDNPFGLE